MSAPVLQYRGPRSQLPSSNVIRIRVHDNEYGPAALCGGFEPADRPTAQSITLPSSPGAAAPTPRGPPAHGAALRSAARRMAMPANGRKVRGSLHGF
jgi:hypothetical protein